MRRFAATVTTMTLTCSLTGSVAACSIQTAGAPKGDVTVSATFDDVQSLVIGHGVQVSDVRIGTVTGIELSGYRAKVTMSLRRGRRLPVGTTATIAKTSLLGENYVRLDLPPGRALGSRPYLADKATISRTGVAPDLEQLTAKLGPVLTGLGGQDVTTIVDASATAVTGKGKELNDLIKRSSKVTAGYAAARADIVQAIDSLGELGDGLAASSHDVDRLPGDILVATRRLQADRGKLKRALQQLNGFGETFNASVQERHAARLRVLLHRADALLGSAVRGRQELKTLAETLLGLVSTPRASYGGQALLYIWLKGLLPPAGGGGAGTASRGAALGRPSDLAGPR